MAQKANPITLRPTESFYQSYSHWDEPRFCYILPTINKLIESCCLGTTHFINSITVNKFLGSLIIIKVNFIHLHTRSKRRLKSRRYKENKLTIKKQYWTIVAYRLQRAIKLIQDFTGTKKVTTKVNRLKTYTRAIPKYARKQIAYYTKKITI